MSIFHTLSSFNIYVCNGNTYGGTSQSRDDDCSYHTSTDFSSHKILLLKLAKSLENDLHPEKCVLVEKLKPSSVSANQRRCLYTSYPGRLHLLSERQI